MCKFIFLTKQVLSRRNHGFRNRISFKTGTVTLKYLQHYRQNFQLSCVVKPSVFGMCCLVINSESCLEVVCAFFKVHILYLDLRAGSLILHQFRSRNSGHASYILRRIPNFHFNHLVTVRYASETLVVQIRDD